MVEGASAPVVEGASAPQVEGASAPEVESTDVPMVEGASVPEVEGMATESVPLLPEETTKLLDAIEEMRSTGAEKEREVCGWKLQYSRRGAGMRGDMVAVDPRDGEKLQSIVGIKRKLGIHTDPAAPDAAKSSRDLSSTAGTVEDMLLLQPSQRRARVNKISYAEAALASRGSGVTKQTTTVLEEAAPLSDEQSGGAQGLDLGDCAELVHARSGAEGSVPYGAVRSSLLSLLRSGRARRILKVLPPPESAAEPGAAEAVADEAQADKAKLEMALRYLVLNTLQVEADYTAPWSLQPPEARPTMAVARPAARPKGRQLLGRRVELWWGGDKAWYKALVSQLNDFDGQWLEGGASGTHVVAYAADGSRSNEDLDGPGEPKHWRLQGEEGWDTDEPPPGEKGKPAKKVKPAAPSARPGKARGGSRARAGGSTEAAEAAEVAEAAEAAEAAAAAAAEVAAAAEAAAAEAAAVEAAAAVAAATATAAGGEGTASGERGEGAGGGAGAEEAQAAEVQEGSAQPAAEAPAEGAEAGEAAGEAAGAAAAEGEGEEEDPWAYQPPPRVESLLSAATVRQLLPISCDDAAAFSAPPGWREIVDASSRRPKRSWVPCDAQGGKMLSFDRRQSLEEHLEREAAKAGTVWLGTVAGGAWQLRQKAVVPALQHVISGLIRSGHVRAVLPERSGKNFPLYTAANEYFKGEAFPRKRAEAEELEPEPEDELAELEMQRLANIKRNHEMLVALGLA